MFPQHAVRTRPGRREAGSFASSLLTFSTLLLVLALGFVFGRVVIARAYVRTSEELKKTGSTEVPGGQALSSSALARSAGGLGETQSVPEGDAEEREASSEAMLPREEVRPEPYEAPKEQTRVRPGPEEENLPSVGEVRYTVQVGAFANEEGARAAATRLTQAGYPARIRVDREARTYRVVTGDYETEGSAQEALREIRRGGFPEAFVVVR